MTRRDLLRTALAGGALVVPKAWRSWANVALSAQASNVSVPSLLLDGFDSELRPNWGFAHTTSAGTVSISSGEVPAVEGSSVLKAVCTAINQPGFYDVYVDFQPWTARQGDSYCWDKALEKVAYVPGLNRALEFWMLPDSRYNAPTTDPGAYATLSFGTYTMAPSYLGQGNQEAGGYHGYHSLLAVATNGRWMKCKMMRPAGFRSGSQPPAVRCVVESTNSKPFVVGETIACAPSGVLLKFGAEGLHALNQRCVFGLWTAPNQIPRPGDTLTGQLSGAVRTISSASHYNPGLYGEGHRTDAIGWWCGYDDTWVQKGGCTTEWSLDQPHTYWDRVTRFYVSILGQTAITAPVTTYFDSFRLVGDNRDDCVAVSSMGAFFDPVTSRLYVTWQRNVDMLGKQWEVRVSHNDLHTAGLSSGTVWKTLADSQNDYTCMSVYDALPGTAGRPLYVGLRQKDRSTFAQISIPTSADQTAATQTRPPSNVRVR